jgi:hypothetical protein
MEADIKYLAGPAGSVANDPEADIPCGTLSDPQNPIYQ